MVQIRDKKNNILVINGVDGEIVNLIRTVRRPRHVSADGKRKSALLAEVQETFEARVMVFNDTIYLKFDEDPRDDVVFDRVLEGLAPRQIRRVVRPWQVEFTTDEAPSSKILKMVNVPIPLRWVIGAQYKLPNSLGSIEHSLPLELVAIVKGNSEYSTWLTFKKFDHLGNVENVHTSRASEKARLVKITQAYDPEQQPFDEGDI
jgi:hypothetical protein